MTLLFLMQISVRFCNDEIEFLFYIATGVISVSWYPPTLADDEGHDVDSVIPLLLDAAHKQKLKVHISNSRAILCTLCH